MIRWEYSIQASDRRLLDLLKLNCTLISIQNIFYEKNSILIAYKNYTSIHLYYFDRASITFSEQCIGSKYHVT